MDELDLIGDLARGAIGPAAAIGRKEITMPTDVPIMRFFDFAHLPEHLQAVSLRFADLAWWIEANIPAGEERSVALRKLLEAKDAAVRAKL
jgi:hypothetical protein